MNRWLLVVLLLLPGLSLAAEPQTKGADAALFEFDNVMKEISVAKSQPDSEITQHRIENEFNYVMVLAGLCMLSLLVVLWFLKQKPETTPKDIVNVAGLTLIVFGTIILVLIVDTTEQLTAAIGILGAIAGYLFRSAQERVVVAAKQRE